MIQEIRRTYKDPSDDRAGEGVLHEIRALGITSVTGVRVVDVYRVEGLNEGEACGLATDLFVETIDQQGIVNGPLLTDGARTAEVAFKPGVMDPASASIMKVAHILGLTKVVAASTSKEYVFYGSPSAEDVETIVNRLLANPTTAHLVTEKPTTLLVRGESPPMQIIPISTLGSDGLMALSTQRKLSLNVEEMHVIRGKFRSLKREPTDCELETLGQTWSEHCGHKTFNARLFVNGIEKTPLMQRLKDASRVHSTNVVSSFVDNSGVIAFTTERGTKVRYAICAKVETHNSPSALEPYGGAATGSGGVFRDIMGTGQGAKVILSTDMFCFAPWTLPASELPPGCLPPDYLLRHVVRGVADYGNRMGVPTANGSIYFNQKFRAKPTVIVGAYGLMPERYAHKGEPQPGDLVIAVGGRTGRDGVHGANFSSLEMTDRTHVADATAVQIGHAIEEKRTSDALLVCRDQDLLRALTDCGAGGFSSAIGEMGKKTGVRIWLERALLKYPGLAGWEIWISEAQERMVLAVPADKAERVIKIFRDHNVEAVILGEFTSTKRLVVTFNDDQLVDLEMDFVHDGLPQRVMPANWVRPVYEEPEIPLPNNWHETFERMVAHPNICSKQRVVNRYDHGVQGTNALAPYGGKFGNASNDAVILTPFLGQPEGMVVSHGMNPGLNDIDPYWGSLWAITEALANYVAVGGNPETGEAALIDNFIWPFPDEQSLGALDMAVDACVDAVHAFGLPFVSGKDSLSSTYRWPDGTVLKIPPVLCISAFGRIPDVAKTVSSEFKKNHSAIVLVGQLDPNAMGGSVYYDLHGAVGNKLPKVDLQRQQRINRAVHHAIRAGKVLACKDVSRGGIGVTLAKMCMGAAIDGRQDASGAWIQLEKLGPGRPDHLLFNEMAGCFLLEVAREDVDTLFEPCDDIPHTVIGHVWEEDSAVLRVRIDQNVLCDIKVGYLKRAWKEPLKEVFP